MKLPGGGSLQVRLALGLAGVYLLATVIAIGALLYQAYSTADALSKEDLNRRAKHLASVASFDSSGQPRIELPEWLAALYRSATFLYAVSQPDGPLIASSSAEAGDLVTRLPAPDAGPAYFRLRAFGPGNKDYFGLTTRVDSRIGPLRVTIARAADDDALVQSLLREFVSDLTWLVPAMIAATLAIGVLAIRRGLNPLRDVSARAAAIDPGSMSVRLPEENVATEIRPLVAAVNHALDRLQQGFAVQRQFTANAAHELRTPLSILSAGLEQLGSDPGVEKLRADAARMNRLVEQLLRVARLDAIALDVSQTVDLSAVARDVGAYLAPLVLVNERMIAAQGVEWPVFVKGNRHALEDAVRNLVENAIAHAPRNTEIVVSVEPDRSLSVADRGPGIRAEDRERIFERFWRGRGSPGQGSGLGLAIVHETMRAHHGTVQVGDNPGGGAVITLVFPDRSTHSDAS